MGDFGDYYTDWSEGWDSWGDHCGFDAPHHRRRRKQAPPELEDYEWITGNGDVVDVRTLETTHLINIRRLIERRGHTDIPVYRYVTEELKKRNDDLWPRRGKGTKDSPIRPKYKVRE